MPETTTGEKDRLVTSQLFAMTKPLFIDALNREHLTALFRDALQFRQDLAPLDLTILNDSVLDFMARNAGSLTALLNNPAFVDRHPAVTAELLERAFARAPGPAARQWVQRQAVEAGFDDLFAVEIPQSLLTETQARAFEQLKAMAILHYRGPVHRCINLRTTPLLVGPSGVGKTHLVERLGQVMHLEVMRVTVGDWMVAGARAEPTTLRQIHARLARGRKFILQIDELDKFRDNHDAWSQAQMTEVYNVLDRRLVGGNWTAEDCRQFRQNVMIIGSGTFQDVWREETGRTLGFGVSGGGFDLVGKIRRALVIPAELLNRFNSEWLVLEPLTREDFERLADEFELGSAVLDPAEAVASGLNFRAIENALTASFLKPVIEEIRNDEVK